MSYTAQDIINNALFYTNSQDFYAIEKSLRLPLVGRAARDVQSEIDARSDILLHFVESVFTYTADSRFMSLSTVLATDIAANGLIKDILRLSRVDYLRLPDSDNPASPIPMWEEIARGRKMSSHTNERIYTHQVSAANLNNSLSSYSYTVRDDNLYLDPIPEEDIYFVIEWRYLIPDPAALDTANYWKASGWYGEFYHLVAIKLAMTIGIKEGRDIEPIAAEYNMVRERMLEVRNRNRYPNASYFDYQKRG